MAPKDGDQDTRKGKDEADEAKGGRRKSAYKLPEAEPARAGSASSSEGEGEGGEVIELPKKTGDGPVGGLFDNKLGDAVKQSFRAYVLENVVPEGQKTGAVDLNVDVDFVKKHGASLLSAIFNSVTKAVVPEKLEVTVPVPVPDEKPAGLEKATGAAEGEPEVKVNVNMDVIKFIKGLLAPRPDAAVASEAPRPTLVKDEDDEN